MHSLSHIHTHTHMAWLRFWVRGRLVGYEARQGWSWIVEICTGHLEDFEPFFFLGKKGTVIQEMMGFHRE